MGCGASFNQILDEQISEHTRSTSIIGWKILQSESEARRKFIADGTLSNGCEFGHLELRTILDDPISQNALGKFASSIKVLDVFICWVDIQEYKSIPTENYRRSKALHIYHKYIKADAVLMISNLLHEERERIRIILEGDANDFSMLSDNLFQNIQHVCFEAMYNRIYLPFREKKEYNELKDRIKKKYNRVKLSDFDYYNKLGEGGYGFVVHCRKKSTGKHYAMKMQLKNSLLESIHENPAKSFIEKLAFINCQHPFIVSLDYAFQTDGLAIMVLELSAAGDLNKLLSRSPKQRLPEDHVQFFAAETILALAYLHQMNLIYRDLKPQNILLKDNGHIQLVDLGGVMDLSGERLGQKKELAGFLPLFSLKSSTNTQHQTDDIYEIVDVDEKENNDIDKNEKAQDNNIIRRNSHTRKLSGGSILNFATSKEFMTDGIFGRDNIEENYNILLKESKQILQQAEKEMKSMEASSSCDKNSITLNELSSGNGSPISKKKTLKRKMSVMGTLGYMAPEMVILLKSKRKYGYSYEEKNQCRIKKTYDNAVDWWSLGVTIFKLLTGVKPFADSDFNAFVTMNETLEQIVKSHENFKEYVKLFQKLSFPEYLSPKARDLIKKLLDVNPATRLGAGPNGLNDLKAHPFFEGIKWDLLESLEVAPRFIPPARTEDLDHLDPYPDIAELLKMYGKKGWLDDKVIQTRQKYFENWDFTSPHTIRVEAGLSKMMDQYEKNLKVQQLMGDAREEMFQSHIMF